MRSFAILGSLMLLLAATAAHAALPTEVLDRDYQACMGGTNEAERSTYCNCIRNGMQNWDLATYASMATDISKAGNNAQLPAELTALAQSCLAKALH